MIAKSPELESITYIEGFEPGYLGRIAQMHGEYYASAWGSGAGFEVIQARELCEFFERYDPKRDLLYTAHAGGRLVGSVAIDGTQEERPGLARLRWFIVEPGYHGKGIGKTLLAHALDFCGKAEFPLVYLWTVEGLPESLHLYQNAGFQIVKREVGSHYTVEHTHIMLEMSL